MQRTRHVVDKQGMNLAAFARRTARKPRFSSPRGIVRTHGENAALTYARGDSARGELVVESGELKWRSGSCGAPLRQAVRTGPVHSSLAGRHPAATAA